MTNETDSVLTTDADFDSAFASAIEVDAEPVVDAPQDDVIETGDDEEVTDIPDSFDTAEDGDGEEPELPSVVSDVARLLDEGDTEKAKQRLAEYGRGVEKLQAKLGEYAPAVEQVQSVKALYQGIGNGEPEAIETIEEVLASHGSSIKDLFAKSIGVTAEDVTNWLENDGVKLEPTKAKPSEDPRLSALEEKLRQIEQKEADLQWLDRYGNNIAKLVEQKTGLKFDPVTIAKVRHELPKKGATVEDVEIAVMKVDPRAYKAAQAAQKGSTTPPPSAIMQKGGKGKSSPDPAKLLSDDAALMKFITSQ